MKKTLITAAVLAALALPAAAGTRSRTLDISFGFRMGAGFPGDVNRTHPASILPRLMDTTNPVAAYGFPVLVNTAANTMRGLLVGDTAVTAIYGVLVRPYPTQQTTGGMASAINTGGVPPVGPAVVDVLREGYIIARCHNFATQQPTLNGAVFVWIAASTGVHVQGGFESVATGGSTIAITNARWCGPTDVTGITEIEMLAA